MDQTFLHFGETMAVLAAFIFAWTSVLFTGAGQRLGAGTVNLLRLPGATLCLGATHLVATGRVWPANMAPEDHFWIALSGVVGLAVGDSALFKAFTTIGPRRSMTMMALAPVVTTVIAWLALGERLGGWALTGILVVIVGVVIATRGRGPGHGRFANVPQRVLRIGLLLAIMASVGQGLGSVFAKMGMTGVMSDSPGVTPLGATLVRITWATICYWLIALPVLKYRAITIRWRERRGLLYLAGAILMGPFISVWISQVAIRHTDAGIAQALLGMVPVFVVAPAWIFYKDRPSLPSLLGILLAVGGGALLFLR